jgi:hypothetical protein
VFRGQHADTMFTILGADGKEYGPVAADKVQEWIRGGRANFQTKARRVEETEWKTLGDFPEFTAAPAAPAATVVGAAAAPGVEALAGKTGLLDIGGCIKRGFATGAANFLPLLGVSLLVGGICGLIGAIPLLGLLFTFTLTGVFYGGLYYYVLKKVRREATEIGDAFSGFSVCFGQLVLATMACTILILIGMVCLILPGIYLAVCWVFTYVLVRDKGLAFWDAMELGRKAITRQWFRVFGLVLLIGLMAAILLAVPMGMLFAAAAKAHASGTPGAPSFVLMGLGGLGMLAVILLIAPFVSAILLHAYEDIFGPAN